MENKNKANIKIEDLTKLSIQNRCDTHEHLKNIDIGSELASFRMQLECQNSNSTSPSHMGLLQISPIEAIIQPSRNFTTESANFLQTHFQSNFILIMPTETDEEDEDLEKSINMLTLNLKKAKSSQYTPTFPIKTDENVSWSDISEQNIQENIKKVSEIEKGSNSREIGTLSELPTLLDENIFGQTPNPEFDEREMEKGIRKKNFECEKIGLKVEEKLNEDKVCILKSKPVKMSIRRVHSRALSTIKIKNDEKTGDVGAKTPIVKKVEKTAIVEKLRSRSIGKVRLKFNSEDLKVKKKVAYQLPELKEFSRPKSRTQISPYSKGCNFSNIKSQINLEAKRQKEGLVVKNQVSKIVKRRVKILK